MRGVILGGGKGTRLYPLTSETSKHLLLIGNKPLIIRVIEQLVKAGIIDILLLIDERYASQFMRLLKDGAELGIRSLAYVWQHADGKGIPTAISQIENFVGNNKIIVACGDVLIENGINKPVSDFLQQKDGARMITAHVDDSSGYSLLRTQKDNINQIYPKNSQCHKSGLIDLGIYMYHSDVFKKIKRLVPSERGETEIWDLNNIYVKNKKLKYTAINGWWSDVGGGLETYLEAHKQYENK